MALYTSHYADLQVLCRPESIHYHPATGVEISRTKALVANFGSHGGEFEALDPLTQQPERHALIFGHYFDSEAAAERLEWTPEERESVEAVLDKLARDQPYLLQKVDLSRPPLPAPWPTYDQTAEKEIVQFAVTLGLVAEALAYERENENRESITKALEAAIEVVKQPKKTEKPEPAAITLG